MTDIDRSKGLILLTIVAVATILGGIALSTVGAKAGEENIGNQMSLVANNKNENTVELTSTDVDAEGGNTVELLTLVDDNNESAADSAGFMPWRMIMEMCPRGGLRGRGRPLGLGGFGFIEVSEEFKENVIAIAESDEDVQALLNDGYNVTQIRPIIKTVVDGEGNIATKATDAIVMLNNEGTGRASVWVDFEESKVTEIMIITRTIIEKP